MKTLPTLPQLGTNNIDARLETIESDTLIAVTGGEGEQGWGSWLREKGDQVLGKFAPSWGVQGQTPTPGGGNAQYRGGESPALPKMPSLPALKQ